MNKDNSHTLSKFTWHGARPGPPRQGQQKEQLQEKYPPRILKWLGVPAILLCWGLSRVAPKEMSSFVEKGME
jgi:hypothetical protein